MNKTTAKAALTQMLSVVFQRMEVFDGKAKAETEAALSALKASKDTRASDAIMKEDSLNTYVVINDSF